MLQTKHDIRQARAVFLLTLFVIGGMLAPMLHRAHHGIAWAEQRAGSVCDHLQHGDRFEETLPEYHADQCLFCLRHQVWIAGFGDEITAFHEHQEFAPSERSIPATSFYTLLSIRGPPRVS